MPKVLVLVLSLDRDPWKFIEDHGQRQTWARNTTTDVVTVRFYYGRLDGIERAVMRYLPGVLQRLHLLVLRDWTIRRVGRRSATRPVTEVGNRVVTSVPETYLTIGAKTLAAFRYILANYEFDYLFRTISSSYVNVDLLAGFCRELGVGHFFGGSVVNHRNVSFASGSGFLISRSLVEAVALDPLFDFAEPDDVAVSKSVGRLGVPLSPIRRVQARSLEDVDALTDDELRSSFHFRCKSMMDRSVDAAIMQRIHERLYPRMA